MPTSAEVAEKSVKVSKGMPFRWILPLGQLVLCALLLWPVRPRIALALHLPVAAGPPLVFRLNGLGLRFVRWAETNSITVVAGLNLPVGFVQIPYAMVSPNKHEWAPPGIDLFVWRAIAWPVLGMVFWWIAGRGAEALAGVRQKRLAPQIHWLEMIVGILLLAMGAFLILAFTLEERKRNDAGDLALLAIAVFWAFLGGLSVAAKIAQWRLKKLGN